MAKPREDKDAQIEHILTQLEEKRSLSEICKNDAGMPRASLFLGWVAKDASLAEHYAHAREAQVIALLEECLQIADEATDDAYITTDSSGKKVAKINGKAVRRAALIVDTRERFAKMMMPERFAQQRMDVTSGGKALPSPVQSNDNRIVALLTLAAERAAMLSAGGMARGGQLIDVTPTQLDDVMS